VPEAIEPGAGAEGAILVARGPRAVEALLLERLSELLAQSRRAPALLARPVRIVVPSHSLADHVGERIVAHAGRSVAGILVQTLYGLALEMLERTGVAAPGSEALFPILVRRLAAEEPLLSRQLGALVDGFAAVEGAVADLLDAGFDEGSGEAVLDALEEIDAREPARETALAVARVARRCLEEMQRGGIGHRALLLRAAREALAADPEAALPSRAVLVHGFADATGLRAELIEGLVRHRHASVLVDEPPDPARPDQPDAGGRFTRRLRDRLRLIAREQAVEPAPTGTITLECVEAARPDTEVREIAARVRAALDGGLQPERIGVVARDLASRRALLRRHFERLGIPFSGGREGGVGPQMRHVRALEVLLREHETCRIERWLDARAPGIGSVEESDLRLGLLRLGLSSLGDLAAHRPAGRDVRLPVVSGWWPDAAPEAEEEMHVERRRLRAQALASAVEAARAACVRLARLRAGGGCARQLGELIDLVEIDLGWDRRRPEWQPAVEALEALRSELPPGFQLGLADLVLLVRRTLAPRFAAPLGGEGGGVQVLDAMEARGRSFERLFTLGLVRDAFPRNVREDPLLPDGLRERVRDVLPDVPVKKLGHDEERYLFAELVASSPHVTLSWPLASDEGRPCARSSFVERLAWSGRLGAAAVARSVLSPAAAVSARLLSLEEHALRAALFGPAERLDTVLPIALRGVAGEILAGGPASSADRLAAARLAILREMEGKPPHAEPQLGPYFGFVGPQRADNDPRSARLYVTTLERLSRCGWQTFLGRLLRLEAPPDADGALPGIDKRLLGSAVHRAIDVAFRVDGDPRAPVREGAARWPDDARLAEITDAAARAVLEEEGVPLRGLVRVLAQRALPFVLRARSLDQAEPEPIEVVAVERERSIEVASAGGLARSLFFRADRIERVGGRERLTDFKTGNPVSKAKKENTRRKALLAAVACGKTLQPVAYARSAPADGVGRLLYLRPDLDDSAAGFSAPRGDAELGAAFDGALEGLFGAWNAGGFLPRMLEADLESEPEACGYCDVAQACLRGDSGSRRRLAAWLAADEADRSAPLGGAERSLLELFRLGAEADGESEDAS
jgi:hypothetical protein